MKKTVLLAGAAALVLSAGVASAQGTGFADPGYGTDMMPGQHHGVHHATAGVKGARTLTVRPRMMAPAPAPVAAGPADVIGGIGNGLATPFNQLGNVGGPVGIGGSVIGSTITGATSIATAPLVGLSGGAVGISPNAAPPLPIKARFAGTGPVAATFDEGFAQDVPVDRSGPIYMIDTKGTERTVTPFSLLAFPVAGATYAITSPLRPVAPHP